MENKKLEVGQILYILSKTDANVTSAQVVKEIYSKTLSEEKRDFVIQTASGQSADLSQISSKYLIYQNVEDVEKTLTDNLLKTVKNVILNLKKEQEQVFGKVEKETQTSKSKKSEQTSKEK